MKYNAKEFNPNKTLKDVREKKAGLSRSEFAKKIGITSEALKTIENRKNPTGMSILKYLQWCDNSGWDIDYLLGVQDIPNQKGSDICSITGLDQSTVELLKNEKAEPIASEIRTGKGAGLITGIATADLFNGFVGSIKGKELKDTMLQYIREKSVFERLEKTVRNIVENHNEIENRSDSLDSLVKYASNILASIRMMTSLSGLELTGIEQTEIDDDYTAFCEVLEKKGKYNKEDCRRVFTYMQSRERVEALKMKCNNLLIEYLDKLSDEKKIDEKQLQLHYHTLGDFDLSAFIPYESIDDIEVSKKETIEASLKRKIREQKAKIEEDRAIKNKLIDGNTKLSDELNEEKRKTAKLQNQLNSIPDDKKDLIIEIARLKEEHRKFMEMIERENLIKWETYEEKK